MKPKDLFGVAVRICGLVLGRFGLMYIYDYWYASNNPYSQPNRGVRPDDLRLYLVFAVVYLAIGIYFVRGAPHLLTFSYPEPEDSKDEHREKSDVYPSDEPNADTTPRRLS